MEDDPLLGESLKEFLEDSGVEVNWIQDERELFKLDLNSYDTVVLDLMLNFLKGEDLLVHIKRVSDVPILILTAKQSLEDKEVCFERGADDYLTKPFEPKELLLRLRALSRRKPLPRIQKIGNVTVDLDAETLFVDGKEVKLSRTAWKLFYLLLKHKGEILSKERIMSYVWEGKPVSDDILRAYIKELRRKLPRNLIETFKGRGYRLKG
ncbi:DNA-binding response OmpR family regulator [Phorcysia thermohydrogeniphila]|uniref:DNA-binding response OmpR family regulator n=1 Tax=Phorcysia thermohydrogeniphila TaxID=936138 RepID=A0A4R1GQ58_9BACT|nr:DNA-binding response OmpR family regulator [Phorcysia thermohydrogeniphila]